MNFARVSKQAVVANRSENVASKNRPDVVCVTQTVFQQDGAPSHRAKLTVEFLQRNVPDFIELALWPPNSPDLNPVDYSVWGALQQMVYRYSVTSLNDLKEKIRHCWGEPNQGLIDRAIDQWRPRLRAVIKVKGGHIEQMFH